MVKSIEARIEWLEAVRRNAVETENPPRNGLVFASDYPDEDSLAAAVVAERIKPGTVGVTVVEFVDVHQT